MTITENVKPTLRQKQVHENRFYNILNVLSADIVEPKVVFGTIPFLSILEFVDIIEERNCKIKCGYVLCNNSHKINTVKAISLNASKRKIFDITNRRKFCSDWCYAAQKHVDSQLPDVPIWSLENYQPKPFTLYPKDSAGCAGEPYFEEDNVELAKEITKLNLEDDSVNDIIKPQKVTPVRSNVRLQPIAKPVVKEKKSLEEIIEQVNVNTEKNKSRQIVLLTEEVKPVVRPSQSEQEVLPILEKAATLISEWITESTKDFVCGTLNNNKNCDEGDDVDNDEDEGDITNKEEKEYADVGPDERPMAYLVLDSTDQLTVRRNHVVMTAKSWLKKLDWLLSDFSLSQSSFISEFRNFIYTCSVTSTNAYFNMKTFKWIVILMVDVLAPKFTDRAHHIDKEAILSKHGLTQISLYDNILLKINNILYDNYNVMTNFLLK